MHQTGMYNDPRGPVSPPFTSFSAVEDEFQRQRHKTLHFLSLPILLSPFSTLYGHWFFGPLAPVPQIMLHRVREKSVSTRRDFKETSNIPSPWPCPYLRHTPDS